MLTVLLDYIIARLSEKLVLHFSCSGASTKPGQSKVLRLTKDLLLLYEFKVLYTWHCDTITWLNFPKQTSNFYRVVYRCVVLPFTNAKNMCFAQTNIKGAWESVSRSNSLKIAALYYWVVQIWLESIAD